MGSLFKCLQWAKLRTTAVHSMLHCTWPVSKWFSKVWLQNSEQLQFMPCFIARDLLTNGFPKFDCKTQQLQFMPCFIACDLINGFPKFDWLSNVETPVLIGWIKLSKFCRNWFCLWCNCHVLCTKINPGVQTMKIRFTFTARFYSDIAVHRSWRRFNSLVSI